MPKTIYDIATEENCPGCRTAKLREIKQEWNPFPGEDPFEFIEFKKCNSCGYELVTRDEVNNKKVPYVNYMNAASAI